MELIELLKTYCKKYLSQIILIAALLVTVFFLVRGCENRLSMRHQYDNNVKALTEQMETWKTKAGDLVAEKTVLEGDVKLLKQTNEELYDQVKKLKAKPAEVVYVNVEVPYPVHDTTFVLADSTNYMKQPFDFSDKWRTLSGYLEYNKPNLGLTIDKDIVYADLTVAIKDSRVFVTSNNPYLQYNDIQGVVLPKTQPRWSIGVGPQFGVGYGFINKKPDIYVGIGVSFNYNLYSFGKKK